MKNIYLSLLTALLLLSCSSEKEELPQQEIKTELLSYNISLGGELAMLESPLKESATRTAANTAKRDLFGIQVYDVYGNPYARVLGDDISRITLDLEQGQEYEIQVTYIKDGKDLLMEFTGENYVYMLPFLTYDYGEATLNEVYYDDADYLFALGSYDITGVSSPTHERHTPADRYYNTIPFLATGEEPEIHMDLKRVSIGITLELDLGEEADMERVIFTPQESRSYEIALTNGKGILEIPYLTLPGDESLRGLDKTIKEEHRETFLFQLGTEENKALLYSGDISVKRNTLYKLKMSYEISADSGNVSINLEDEVMKEENITLPSN